MKAPDDASFQQWQENPEPSLPEHDPRVIMDANIEQTVWLYDIEHEGSRWLTYHGEPEPLHR
jgi:hypothetical protein